MKPTTQEWVDKAEADFAAAILMRRSRKKHSRDVVCFHFQQCVEKYLKGRLEEAALAIPKTHDLERLLTLVLPVEPSWGLLLPEMAMLTDSAVEVRYPGRTISVAEGKMFQKFATHFRDLASQSLGLP